MLVLNKIYQRGAQWFLSRLLQETRNQTSFIGHLLKPFMNMVYIIILYPINKAKFIFSAKKTNTDTLYLFYDLEVSPITFDFGWALALAEQERKKANLKKIYVVFVPGKEEGLRKEDPLYEKCVDVFARRWRCVELLQGMCTLIENFSGMTFCANREEAQYLCENNRPHVFPKHYTTVFPIAHSTRYLLTPSKDAMALRANIQARHYIKCWADTFLNNRKLITITLRSSTYMPERNSNIFAWKAFAKNLDLNKYFPVFIPDTEKALTATTDEWQSFNVFNEPAWNLQLRAALYELSYLNLGVNNGPMALCWLNRNCRYISFKMMIPNEPEKTAKAMSVHGFKQGKSLPFATPLQKWVWEDDDLQIIENEFDLMCQQIEKPENEIKAHEVPLHN